MSAPHKIRTTEITSEPSSRAEYKAEGVRSHHQRIISDNRTLSHISEARRCPSSTPRVSLSIYLSIASQRVLLDEGRATIGAHGGTMYRRCRVCACYSLCVARS